MMTKTYENLCEMLEKEINNIEQQQNKALTKESLELLKCLTETLKNVKYLMDEKEMEDSGMSRRMPYYDEMMSGTQRRDSMGRYMDHDPNMMMDGSMRNSYARGNMSRDYNGYSRDDSRKKMIRKLETLMDDTMSEHEREAIKDCINKIE